MSLTLDSFSNADLAQLIVDTAVVFSNSLEAYAEKLATDEKTTEAALNQFRNVVVFLANIGASASNLSEAELEVLRADTAALFEDSDDDMDIDDEVEEPSYELDPSQLEKMTKLTQEILNIFRNTPL